MLDVTVGEEMERVTVALRDLVTLGVGVVELVPDSVAVPDAVAVADAVAEDVLVAVIVFDGGV